MSSRAIRAAIAAVTVTVLSVGLNPRPVLADDASRISYLELEIQRLRSRVDEQQRRILRLEEELNRRTGGPPIPKIPEVRDDRAATTATGSLPWHSREPWARVTEGMTEAEVTSTLGEPTYSESIDSFTTLFYHGLVAGSGSMSGHVNLRDGRVVAVNKPEFDR